MTDPRSILARGEALDFLRDDDNPSAREFLMDHFAITDEELDPNIVVRVPRSVWAQLDRALNNMHVSLMDAVRDLLANAEELARTDVEWQDRVAPLDTIRALERRLDLLRPHVEGVPGGYEIKQNVLTDAISLSRDVDGFLSRTDPPDSEYKRLLAIARWMHDHRLPTANAEYFRKKAADG